MGDSPPLLTPRMQHTLERTAELARERGHGYIGTEHVQLALAEDRDGIAGGTLASPGVAERVAQQIRSVMDSPGYSEPGHRPPGRGS